MISVTASQPSAVASCNPEQVSPRHDVTLNESEWCESHGQVLDIIMTTDGRVFECHLGLHIVMCFHLLDVNIKALPTCKHCSLSGLRKVSYDPDLFSSSIPLDVLFKAGIRHRPQPL